MKEARLPFKYPKTNKKLTGSTPERSRPKARSPLEEKLAVHIKVTGLPAPVREYRFDPERRWRVDFAWPELKICCEVEGGIWTHGRHQRPLGFQSDAEKYNSLVLGDWKCLRFTSLMITDGSAIRILERLLPH